MKTRRDSNKVQIVRGLNPRLLHLRPEVQILVPNYILYSVNRVVPFFSFFFLQSLLAFVVSLPAVNFNMLDVTSWRADHPGIGHWVLFAWLCSAYTVQCAGVAVVMNRTPAVQDSLFCLRSGSGTERDGRGYIWRHDSIVITRKDTNMNQQ